MRNMWKRALAAAQLTALLFCSVPCGTVFAKEVDPAALTEAPATEATAEEVKKDSVGSVSVPADGGYLGMNFEGTDAPMQIFGTDDGMIYELYSGTDDGTTYELSSHQKASHPRTENYTKRFGIDVSKWQYKTKNANGRNEIDWNKVRDAGVEFVIVKIAGRDIYPDEETGTFDLYADPMFEYSLKGAAKAGLKVGGYFYSQAVTEEEAIEEARYMLDLVAGYQIDLPLFFDYEWSSGANAAGQYHRLFTDGGDNETRTKVCDAFCKTIQSYGYATGVYSSDNILTNKVDCYALAKKYRICLAHYISDPEEDTDPDLPTDERWYQGDVDYYQYTSKLYVDGITANYVDHNFWYDDGTMLNGKDYSKIFNATYYASHYPDVVQEMGSRPADLLKHFVEFGIKEHRQACEEFEVNAYRFYNPDLEDKLHDDYGAYIEHYLHYGYSEGRPAREPEADGVTTQVFRLYNKWTGEHLYTLNPTERNNLMMGGWRPEGVAWRAPVESDTPVMRLYNPTNGDHHYTKNAYEVALCLAAGWREEGVAWYSDDARSVSLYRLYNPNTEEAGAHHYTVNANEVALLKEAGWRTEGTAWYAVQVD